MPQCQYCHEPIPEQVQYYTLRMELFPSVEQSIQEIESREAKVDFETEMQRLIELMEQMDEREVARQEKLIYTSHTFTLCPGCRDKIADLISRLTPPPLS